MPAAATLGTARATSLSQVYHKFMKVYHWTWQRDPVVRHTDAVEDVFAESRPAGDWLWRVRRLFYDIVHIYG
jgi:hypothetical protein